MFKYILKRVGQSLITLCIVITVVFMLMRLMPEEGYFSEGYDKMTRTQIDATLTEMGLKDPALVQLGKFFGGLVQGDLGRSNVFRPKVSINTIIAPKIPLSLYFGLASISISMLVGIPMGMLMAKYKGKFFDSLGSGYVVFIKAVPPAVYYLFLQIYLTSLLKIPMLFNESKPITWVLPALCMSLGGISNYAMWIRRYMVDELNKDYIKLARAKGLKNSLIMTKHVIRNAFVPMSQQLPANILMTIAGSIYVESLFSIPGMGGLLVTAIQRQDNTLVQALVVIYSSIGIFGLLLGDVLMATFDPRINLNKKVGAR